MAKNILVPLSKGDRMEEIVPYLEKVAQKDSRVVFLIRHPENGFKWLQAYCGIMECGLDNAMVLRRMMESYSVKMRSQLAQQKVYHTCEALQRLGVKTTVVIRSGGFRKTLNHYLRNGDVELVVMRPRVEFQVLRTLKKAFAGLSGLKRASVPPMLLLHPGA